MSDSTFVLIISYHQISLDEPCASPFWNKIERGRTDARITAIVVAISREAAVRWCIFV